MADALETIVNDLCAALDEQQRSEFIERAKAGQRHAVIEAILYSSFKMSNGGAEVRRKVFDGFTAKPSRA